MKAFFPHSLWFLDGGFRCIYTHRERGKNEAKEKEEDDDEEEEEDEREKTSTYSARAAPLVAFLHGDLHLRKFLSLYSSSD